MKIRNIKKYILITLTAIFITVSANAFFLPPGPLTPTSDFITDVLMAANTATTAVQNATAQASAFIQEINQRAKAALSKYVGKFTGFMDGIFKKEEKQALPGTKEIQKSKIVDIYDPSAVQQIIYTLFFQYPVDCSDRNNEDNIVQCDAYDALAKEFYQDTVIELYTSSRELEKQFDIIETSIAEIESALHEGKNGAEKPDDENGVWKNAYNTYETINTILKIIEEVNAMRAQYIAAQAINAKIVHPANPEKKNKDKKASVLLQGEPLKLASSVKYSTKLHFANISDEEDNSNSQKANFIRAESGLKSPFEGNSADMALMDNIYKAYNTLAEAIEVHNLAKSLSTIRQSYSNYNKAEKLHQKGLELLQETEQCAINYYGKLYSNPEKFWRGNLSANNLTNDSERKGISGWAFKAYNLAKAEDTGTVVDINDYAEPSLNVDKSGEPDLSKNASIAAQIDKNSGGFSDAKKEQEYNSQMRNSALIEWQIGAQAARMLADDQLNGNQWGRNTKKYPIWGDTQSYYNQYLDGKYENIIKQLELIPVTNLAFLVADEIHKNRNYSDDEEKLHNSEWLVKLEGKISQLQDSTIEGADKIIDESKQKLNAFYAEKERQLKILKDEENKAIADLNAVQRRLNSLNADLQYTIREKNSAEAKISAAESVIRSYNYLGDDSYDEPYDVWHARLVISENQNKIPYLTEQQRSLNQEISVKEQEKNRLTTLLEETIPSKVTAVKEKYVQDTTKEKDDCTQKVRELDKEYREIIKSAKNVDLLSLFNQHFGGKVPTQMPYETENGIRYKSYKFSLPSILQDATKIVEDTREASYEMIKQAQKQMYASPNVYYPRGEEQTVNIHKQLMTDLKQIPAEKLTSFSSTISSYSNVGDVMELITAIYQKYMLEQACKNDSCMEVDTEYYVSNSGKIRDFKAPKGSPQDALPTPRETIYFDYQNYDAVSKSGNYVDPEAFLDSLDYVPDVWRLMLKSPAYVEKDIDLEAALSNADSHMFDQGGIFPCRYGSYVVTASTAYGTYVVGYQKYYPVELDDDGNDTNKNIRNAENSAYHSYMGYGYHQCKNIEIDGEPQDGELTVHDKITDISSPATKSQSLNLSTWISGKRPNSELGIFLEYRGGLRFKSNVAKTLGALSRQAQGGNASDGAENVIYDYASFNRNQIGEFLKSMDMVQSSKQNMIEAKLSIEEAKQDLNEVFSKIGFAPKSDFDLSKDSDYELAHSTLLRYRNQLIASAQSQAQSAQSSSNDVIKERMVKINNMMKAMKKDSEALVTLGEQSADDAELDEKIKSEKTNKTVADKYEKEDEQNFIKELQHIKEVYCAEMIHNM